MNKYEIGDVVKGKVTGIEDYGIFMLIDGDVTGLIHISEISHSFVRRILDYVSIDEIISAKVIGFDEKHQKLKLSIKDFNYRDDVFFSSGIKETKSGFSNLGKKLNEWVSIKEAEIEEKNCKK